MKRFLKCQTLVIVMVLCFTPPLLLAEISREEALSQVNNSFTASANFMHFNYREYPEDPLTPLIEDYGNAYGIMLNYRNLFFNRIYNDFSLEYMAGKLQYDGYRSNTSIKTAQKIMHNFLNTDVKLGIIVLDQEYFQIIPYGGLGFRYWGMEGDVRYYNFKALVGAKVNCALTENLIISSYVNVGTTFWPRSSAPVCYAAVDPVVCYGRAHYKLGTKAIREVGLEMNYRLDNEFFLVSTLSHTHFEYGKSGPQSVGSFPGTYEPYSKTNELRFCLGIRIGFM